MGERPGAREAIDNMTRDLVTDSRRPGARPLTEEQARKIAVDVAIRHDRRNPR